MLITKQFREPKLFSYQISSLCSRKGLEQNVSEKMNINFWVNCPFKDFAVLMTNVAVFCMSQVNLKSGTNILYWRTTGMLLGGKPVKPVLLKNIQIEGVRFWWNHVYFCVSHPSLWRIKMQSERCDILWSHYVFFLHVLSAGVAYTSECFPCRPGTFSKTPGSSSCDLCLRNTYSGKGASSCTPCSKTQYSPYEHTKINHSDDFLHSLLCQTIYNGLLLFLARIQYNPVTKTLFIICIMSLVWPYLHFFPGRYF